MFKYMQCYNTVELILLSLIGGKSVREGMKAELRAVCLGLVAVVDDPVDESRVSVVLE